jgi:hypothetical protein
MLFTIQFRNFYLLLHKKLNIKIYKTIILHCVLYGGEIWPLILMGKHRMRVFERRVLRKIFGLKER